MGDMAGENPVPTGKRTRKRDSLLLMGTIKAAGDYTRQTQPIRIHNLSSTGLMANSQLDYDEGAIVEVEIRGLGIVKGEIVWVRGAKMGINFDEPVDPQRARRSHTVQADEHLRKIIDLGRVRRPGLRID